MSDGKLIYIASPCAGDIEKNTAYARECCLSVISSGNVPFAPHVFYPQFLNDADPEERRRGMECGKEILKRCDELWAFGPQISSGMREEIEEAKKHGIHVRYVCP